MKKDSALLLVNALINLALGMPKTFFLAGSAVLLDVSDVLAFATSILKFFPYQRWR